MKASFPTQPLSLLGAGFVPESLESMERSFRQFGELKASDFRALTLHFDNAEQSSTLKEPKSLALSYLARIARERASCPISNYAVGSACLTSEGKVYAGANMEFLGEPLSAAVHAEQSGLSNAIDHGASAFEAIAVTEIPCGHCRQFMTELADYGDLRVIVESASIDAKLGALIPFAFSSRSLGKDAAMGNGNPGSYDLRQTPNAHLAAPLEIAALEAISHSYAPITNCDSSVALEFSDGSIVTGAYIENGAFNPSLSPVQSALSNAAMQGKNLADIRQAVLLEQEGGQVSHSGTLGSVLSTVAGSAQMRVSSI